MRNLNSKKATAPQVETAATSAHETRAQQGKQQAKKTPPGYFTSLKISEVGAAETPRPIVIKYGSSVYTFHRVEELFRELIFWEAGKFWQWLRGINDLYAEIQANKDFTLTDDASTALSCFADFTGLLIERMEIAPISTN